MNGTNVSNGTRLSPISISQRSFGNFPESLGKWKTPLVKLGPKSLRDGPLACLQAVTGGFIAENPFRSVSERPLGFLRRALPGTSGRAQKSREGGALPAPSPRSLCQLSTRPRPGRANSRWRPHYEFRFFFDHPTACAQDICKDKGSNLGPVAATKAEIIQS